MGKNKFSGNFLEAILLITLKKRGGKRKKSRPKGRRKNTDERKGRSVRRLERRREKVDQVGNVEETERNAAFV